jgi:ATP-dependent exoDNAse (exonuclease V) beta subunit
MINEVLGYRGIYKQDSNEPYRISRSKIDLFINCPRCFWLETKLGIKQPPGFPFNINSAIDNLFKNEFDYYRQKKEQHPIQKEYKLKGILPYQHDSLDIWRDAFKGVQFLDKKNNLVLFGGVDDIWVDSDGALIVVDYKSTAKKDDITELNADWHIGYKRQLDIYTWLLQKLDFKVSDKAYWVYANGIADEPFLTT